MVVGEDCKILGVDVWGYMMYTFLDVKIFERSIRDYQYIKNRYL